MKRHGWAIKWREESLLDGKVERLLGRYGLPNTDSVPDFMGGYRTMLFKTRQDARDYISKHYSYIKKRPDLRSEPHGWKMPVPVKVSVEVKEVS